MTNSSHSNFSNFAESSEKLLIGDETAPPPVQGDPKAPQAARIISARMRKDLVEVAVKIIEMRNFRHKIFENRVFGEPGWNILLDLVAADDGDQQCAVTDLFVDSPTAPTTLLRWVINLMDMGLISRSPDTLDQRRSFVSLTPLGREKMTIYLSRIRNYDLH